MDLKCLHGIHKRVTYADEPTAAGGFSDVYMRVCVEHSRVYVCIMHTRHAYLRVGGKHNRVLASGLRCRYKEALIKELIHDRGMQPCRFIIVSKFALFSISPREEHSTFGHSKSVVKPRARCLDFTLDALVWCVCVCVCLHNMSLCMHVYVHACTSMYAYEYT
jgi:hypothetical protein